MKVFATLTLALALPALAGCAMFQPTEYHVTRSEGGVTAEIHVRTFREFPGGLVIDYDRESGSFRAEAGDIQTGYSPLEEAAAAIIASLPVILGAPTQPLQEGGQ